MKLKCIEEFDMGSGDLAPFTHSKLYEITGVMPSGDYQVINDDGYKQAVSDEYFEEVFMAKLKYVKEFYMEDRQPAPFTLGREYKSHSYYKSSKFHYLTNDHGKTHIILLDEDTWLPYFDARDYFELIEE